MTSACPRRPTAASWIIICGREPVLLRARAALSERRRGTAEGAHLCHGQPHGRGAARTTLRKIEASDVHGAAGAGEGQVYSALGPPGGEHRHREELHRACSRRSTIMAETYDMPILYSCHPRSRKVLRAARLSSWTSGCSQHEPLGFHDYNRLQMNAFCVVCDSGTLPEEASFFTSRRASLPRGVHPHLHRTARGVGQRLLYPGGHQRGRRGAGRG